MHLAQPPLRIDDLELVDPAFELELVVRRDDTTRRELLQVAAHLVERQRLAPPDRLARQLVGAGVLPPCRLFPAVDQWCKQHGCQQPDPVDETVPRPHHASLHPGSLRGHQSTCPDSRIGSSQ